MAGVNIHSEISKWFHDEEYYWRSLASYIWLTIMFPPVCGLYIFCINVSLLSPVKWLMESFAMLFTTNTIATIIILQVVCALTTIAHARALSVQKIQHTSQLKFVLFLLHPKQLINIICFVTASSLICSILKNFGSDLSNNSVFLSGFGVFMGLYYALVYYKRHGYIAEFPVIQQTRFFRLKKKLNMCLMESSMFTLRSLQYYYTMYILIGLVPESIIPASFNLNQETSFFGTLANLTSISLLFTCFCISMVLVFVLRVSNILVEIFNTQIYTFAIIASLPEQENKTLADAMESNNILLKHLACLDYNSLSTYAAARRLKMFDLSPPGNQAHCWNRTSTESLKIIQEMRSQLTKEHEQKQLLKIRKTLNAAPPKDIGSQELFSAEPEVPEKVTTKNTSWFSPSKLLHLSQGEKKEVKEENVSLKLPAEPMAGMFDNVQIAMLCLEGLCNLVAASIKEDKYGVVQKKLPDIIGELLLLLEACEFFSKMSFNVPSSNHSQHVEAAQINNCHATSLKLAVKTGLYTITTAFGYHVSNIRLPSDQKKRLHAFLEFAE